MDFFNFSEPTSNEQYFTVSHTDPDDEGQMLYHDSDQDGSNIFRDANVTGGSLYDQSMQLNNSHENTNTENVILDSNIVENTPLETSTIIREDNVNTKENSNSVQEGKHMISKSTFSYTKLIADSALHETETSISAQAEDNARYTVLTRHCTETQQIISFYTSQLEDLKNKIRENNIHLDFSISNIHHLASQMKNSEDIIQIVMTNIDGNFQSFYKIKQNETARKISSAIIEIKNFQKNRQHEYTGLVEQAKKLDDLKRLEVENQHKIKLKINAIRDSIINTTNQIKAKENEIHELDQQLFENQNLIQLKEEEIERVKNNLELLQMDEKEKESKLYDVQVNCELTNEDNRRSLLSKEKEIQHLEAKEAKLLEKNAALRNKINSQQTDHEATKTKLQLTKEQYDKVKQEYEDILLLTSTHLNENLKTICILYSKNLAENKLRAEEAYKRKISLCNQKHELSKKIFDASTQLQDCRIHINSMEEKRNLIKTISTSHGKFEHILDRYKHDLNEFIANNDTEFTLLNKLLGDIRAKMQAKQADIESHKNEVGELLVNSLAEWNMKTESMSESGQYLRRKCDITPSELEQLKIKRRKLNNEIKRMQSSLENKSKVKQTMQEKEKRLRSLYKQIKNPEGSEAETMSTSGQILETSTLTFDDTTVSDDGVDTSNTSMHSTTSMPLSVSAPTILKRSYSKDNNSKSSSEKKSVTFNNHLEYRLLSNSISSPDNTL